MTNLEAKLIQAGNEWEKNGNHRIYFDNTYLTNLMNTNSIENYKEKMSVINAISGAKLHYDFSDQKFHWFSDNEKQNDIIKNVISTIKSLVEKNEVEEIENTEKTITTNDIENIYESYSVDGFSKEEIFNMTGVSL